MKATGEKAADRAIRTALSLNQHSIEIESISRPLKEAAKRDDQECLARFAFWAATGYEHVMSGLNDSTMPTE